MVHTFLPATTSHTFLYATAAEHNRRFTGTHGGMARLSLPAEWLVKFPASGVESRHSHRSSTNRAQPTATSLKRPPTLSTSPNCHHKIYSKLTQEAIYGCHLPRHTISPISVVQCKIFITPGGSTNSKHRFINIVQ